MHIPRQHPPLVIGTKTHNLAHLGEFQSAIPLKGRVAQTDLNVRVSFSCHCYTKRCGHQDRNDMLDHRGNPRMFCEERYELSKHLGALIAEALASDALTFVGKDYNSSSNLILVETPEGQAYSVVFYFAPIPDEPNMVKMEIVSAFAAGQNTRTPYKRPMSFYARTCLFSGKRTP